VCTFLSVVQLKIQKRGKGKVGKGRHTGKVNLALHYSRGTNGHSV